MIISVEEFKKFVATEEADEVLSSKLAAVELLIRKYTNNNFQKRAFRAQVDISSGIFLTDSRIFRIGDTIQISNSKFNEGLYTVSDVKDSSFKVKESVYDEGSVTATKIEYPSDIKMGVVNMLKWDLENRDKVGIASETLSRHSVTYFNMDGDNSVIGYPKSLTGFLRPYMKARF